MSILGIPTPTVQWFIDEDAIPSDDDYYEISYEDGVAKLTMSSIDVNDEGEYMVVATNDFGTASTTCEVVLEGL